MTPEPTSLPGDKVMVYKNAVVTPPKWNRRSRAPYYKQSYGAWLAPILATVQQNKEREFFLGRHQYRNITSKTLYAMVNQAFNFLVDYVSPSYMEMKANVIVKQCNDGVIIRWKLTKLMEPIMIDTTEWRNQIDTFLIHAENDQRLELRNIRLTAEDIAGIDAQVRCTEDFHILELTPRCCRIVKKIGL